MRSSVRRARIVPGALAACLMLAACGSGTSPEATASAATTSAPPSAAASSPTGSTASTGSTIGAPPGGAGSSTAQYTATGTYTRTEGTAAQTGQAYTSSTDNQSGVLVSGSATLTLTSPTVTTSGNSSSLDESSFYGLNGGVLAESGGTIVVAGGSVATSGTGANGVFASGTGSSITLSDTTINATGQGGHGAMASGGGTLSLTNVNIDTAGTNSAAIATDRGGGTISVTGGTSVTSGVDSPGIYSTGTISAANATLTASGSEAVVIEGSNAVTLTNSVLYGAKKWGVLIYQSMSGDANGANGLFTMTGGSLSAAVGPVFYVTNSTGTIALSGVRITATSGTLLEASASSWGTSGSNGGTAVLTASEQTLTGNLVADAISSISTTLEKGSALTGSINGAATAKAASLTLDSSSTWTVTADSHLSGLIGVVVSGASVTNIVGNGHTVTYDATLAANSSLGGRTYSLANGGQLTPA